MMRIVPAAAVLAAFAVPAAAQEAPALTIAEARASTAGAWEGQLQYLDYSSGKWEGIPVPELNDVIEACISMHNELPAHVEVSWDVLLTDNGPVYLEGNIFPPGCDYKLTIFKKWENFKYLKDRLLHLNG